MSRISKLSIAAIALCALLAGCADDQGAQDRTLSTAAQGLQTAGWSPSLGAYGDLTGDEVINVLDVQCLALTIQAVNGETALPKCLTAADAADLNCDGERTQNTNDEPEYSGYLFAAATDADSHPGRECQNLRSNRDHQNHPKVLGAIDPSVHRKHPHRTPPLGETSCNWCALHQCPPRALNQLISDAYVSYDIRRECAKNGPIRFGN